MAPQSAHLPRLGQHLVRSVGYLAAVSRVFADGDGVTTVKYRYESYDEADNRVDVLSHMMDLRHETAGGTALGVRYALDSLSGATPVGTYERSDPSVWKFAEIEDERRSLGLTIEQKIDDYTLAFEYVHSVDSDYISNSFALSGKVELFDKNTVISAGVAVLPDTVVATPFTVLTEDQDKDTVDLALGVSQVITKTTVFDVNFTYGRSRGYLSDPYRQISQTDTFLVDTPIGPFPITDTFDYAENRPDERTRMALQLTGRQLIDPLHASVVAGLRWFGDGDGIRSQTFSLTWNQEVGDRLILSPFFRFYNQSAADYYYPSLTGTGIVTTGANDGTGPHYSSDYRVSAMQSVSYGVGAEFRINEMMALSLKFERYEMSGQSAETPDIFFPTAQVASVGVSLTF